MRPPIGRDVSGWPGELVAWMGAWALNALGRHGLPLARNGTCDIRPSVCVGDGYIYTYNE